MTKGTRRERQAKEIYEHAGYAVANPERSKYGANDFYNHWDLVAMQPGREPRFVQVKSNVARGIGKVWREAQEYFAFEHCTAEFAVCHDSEGWRLLSVTESGHTTVYDEREHDCQMGSGLTAYLS
jgi:hypothetical protein